jgi:hypothetical protein
MPLPDAEQSFLAAVADPCRRAAAADAGAELIEQTLVELEAATQTATQLGDLRLTAQLGARISRLRGRLADPDPESAARLDQLLRELERTRGKVLARLSSERNAREVLELRAKLTVEERALPLRELAERYSYTDPTQVLRAVRQPA